MSYYEEFKKQKEQEKAKKPAPRTRAANKKMKETILMIVAVIIVVVAVYLISANIQSNKPNVSAPVQQGISAADRARIISELSAVQTPKLTPTQKADIIKKLQAATTSLSDSQKAKIFQTIAQ